MSEQKSTVNDPNPAGTAAALVHERAGLARRAAAATDDAKKKLLTDRVRQVDEQLKARGYNAKGDPVNVPKERQAPPQQTA
ncbi:hypothetical protein AB0M35_18075 [Micromonospora sp. NPDC051196]|uniref:hypothetical protein n=1 Tax=Micromonospora sp. NPDC051196 TaxID=3155281 RepID=UPI00342B9A83